jgi:bisphosphoglycerate-dependent phosphoglycerate mutase
MPEHRFHGRLNWNPVNSFGIWTTINIRSLTNWSSVSLLDGEALKTNYGKTDVTYRSTLPGIVRWDAGFHKMIWDERIAFRLQVQNLLNNNYRAHPLGPERSFTVFLGMSIKLD